MDGLEEVLLFDLSAHCQANYWGTDALCEAFKHANEIDDPVVVVFEATPPLSADSDWSSPSSYPFYYRSPIARQQYAAGFFDGDGSVMGKELVFYQVRGDRMPWCLCFSCTGCCCCGACTPGCFAAVLLLDHRFVNIDITQRTHDLCVHAVL